MPKKAPLKTTFTKFRKSKSEAAIEAAFAQVTQTFCAVGVDVEFCNLDELEDRAMYLSEVATKLAEAARAAGPRLRRRHAA